MGAFPKACPPGPASRIGGNAEHERAPYIARSSLKSARRGQTQGAHLFGAFRPGLARPEQISFAHVLLSIGTPAFAAEMVRRLGQGRIAAPVPGLSLKPDEDTAELAFLGARVRLALRRCCCPCLTRGQTTAALKFLAKKAPYKEASPDARLYAGRIEFAVGTASAGWRPRHVMRTAPNKLAVGCA